MKNLVIFGALIFALGGCAATGGGNSSSSNAAAIADVTTAKAAIDAAEAALKQARGIEGEWRDAKKKMIRKAKAATSKGDYAKAIKLANMAKFQGDMGHKQAMAQKNAKPWLF